MKKYAGLILTGVFLLVSQASALGAGTTETDMEYQKELEEKVEKIMEESVAFPYVYIDIYGGLVLNISTVPDDEDQDVEVSEVFLSTGPGSFFKKGQEDDTIHGHLVQELYIDEMKLSDLNIEVYKENCPDNEEFVDFYFRFDEGQWYHLEGVDIISSDENYQFFDAVLDSEDWDEHFKEMTNHEIYEDAEGTSAILKSDRSLLDYKNYIDKYVNVDKVLSPEEEELLLPYLDALKISFFYEFDYDKKEQTAFEMDILDSDMDKVNEFFHMLMNLYYDGAGSKDKDKLYFDVEDFLLGTNFHGENEPIVKPEGIDKAVKVEALQALGLWALYLGFL